MGVSDRSVYSVQSYLLPAEMHHAVRGIWWLSVMTLPPSPEQGPSEGSLGRRETRLFLGPKGQVFARHWPCGVSSSCSSSCVDHVRHQHLRSAILPAVSFSSVGHNPH